MALKLPTAPANLAATAGDGQVSLSWTPSAEASAYAIYRRPALGMEDERRLIRSNWTMTSFEDTGLTNGSPYCYVVRASNASGHSDPSNEVSATPQGARHSGGETIPAHLSRDGGSMEQKNVLDRGLRIRYEGSWETRDYPHRLALLDLEDQLQRWGLPGVQQVAYRPEKKPRELCLKFKQPPPDDEELSIPAGAVRLAWLNWPGRHKSLDAKLVFIGLEEALSQCGYKVQSCIRAKGQGSPIAMMVKFATTPSQPEWTGIEE